MKLSDHKIILKKMLFSVARFLYIEKGSNPLGKKVVLGKPIILLLLLLLFTWDKCYLTATELHGFFW